MKKYILAISVLVLFSTIYVLAQNNGNEEVCSADSGDADCISCPCTPDCQPGDEHCTCPLVCLD